MKDRLEIFFRKKLTEPQKKEAWNTPSDEIWEMARPHFEVKRKRRRRIFIGLFLLLFAGIGTVGWLLLNDAENPPAAEVSKNEIRKDIASRDQGIKHMSPSERGLEDEMVMESPIPTQPMPVPQPAPHSVPALKSHADRSRPIVEMPVFAKQAGVAPYSQQQQRFATNMEERIEHRAALKKNSLESLPPLQPVLEVQPETATIAGPGLPAVKHISPDNRFAVRVFNVPLVTAFSSAQDMNFGNPVNVSHSFGVGAEYAIHKHWWLGLGVSVLHLNSRITYSGSQNYDATTEYYFGGGMMANDVSFQTTSSLGERFLTATVLRSNMEPIPQGTQLEARLTSGHRLTYFNLPVVMLYRRNLGGKFSVFGGGGPGFNWLLAERLEKTGKVLHQDKPMEVIAMNASSGHIETKNWWSVDAKAGLEYRFRQDVSVYSSFRFKYGFTPFLSADDIYVKYREAGIALGLRYAFY